MPRTSSRRPQVTLKCYAASYPGVISLFCGLVLLFESQSAMELKARKPLSRFLLRDPGFCDLAPEKVPGRKQARFPSTISVSSERLLLLLLLNKICSFIFNLWSHPAACEILFLWPGIEPVLFALERQSLNHWTAREVPNAFYPGWPSCQSLLPLKLAGLISDEWNPASRSSSEAGRFPHVDRAAQSQNSFPQELSS